MSYVRNILIMMIGCVGLANISSANYELHFEPVARTADNHIVGDSTLLRYSNRINVIIRTTDLDPGAAITVWWRIYNRPRHCAIPFACESSDLSNPKVNGSQLHATAFVVDNASGAATVVATLYRTAGKAQGGQSFSDSLTEEYLNGRGLRQPMNAEIEVLLSSHGALADPLAVGEEAALDQLLSLGATPIDCAVPGEPTASRTFRCGVIQKANHPGWD